MRLTRAASYSLRAVVHIAKHAKEKKNEKEPVASHVIARERKKPERFLLKVLKPLVAAQVLNSIKGPNGGYSLARSANEINILEIIEAVDGPIRGNSPAGNDDSDMQITKHLEKICNQIAEMIRKHLTKIKISELISKEL